MGLLPVLALKKFVFREDVEMKPGIPWSVKGIEPDAREAAKQAARRSGMTLGEWLNGAILETAEPVAEQPKAKPASRSAASTERRGQGDDRRQGSDRRRSSATLEDIAEQLQRLQHRETASKQHISLDDDERAHTNDALNKILTRVESNERQTVEAFTAVNERLGVLGRQMAQAVRPREDGTGVASLEKAVRNIVEHMEASEKRTRENLKSLHERISGHVVQGSQCHERAGAEAGPCLLGAGKPPE